MSDRLLHVIESALLQRPLAFFLNRNNVDGNVPGLRVVLQAIQYRPAVAIGQADIQSDGRRLVFSAPARGPWCRWWQPGL